MASRAQIIATIGPASGGREMIARMIAAGMDIARLNFSHTTHEMHGQYIADIRACAAEAGKHVPIIQDLSGPRMKTDGGHAFDDEQSVITEKDLSDLSFGIAQGVDYVAQSYVGTADDVRALRAEMETRGARIPIIAKIERAEAVRECDAIIAEADAVMVARGDLGLSVPIEDIPLIERDIVTKARAAGKPVIVATQMLLSMTEYSEPTRAEVTDVEYAIFLGADAVMLSEETARGTYPAEAVAMMERIVSRAEREEAGSPLHPLA